MTTAAGRDAVHFSICEHTTLGTFTDNLAACRAGGAEGIGIYEPKLPKGRDSDSLVRLRESGLRATFCLPEVNSILPLPHMPGPMDPAERVAALCEGIRRFAQFDPLLCVCVTGPLGDSHEREAREAIVNGFRAVAQCAEGVGVPLALEPIHASAAEDWSVITTLPETIALLDEIGAPNFGVLFDVWHLWDTPGVIADIQRYAERISGVHMCDWRDPTRGWCDRVLPGDGLIDLPGIVRALQAGGYDTRWYEMEIFSDNGQYGNDYPDSLWNLEPADLVRRGREAFERVWEATAAAAALES